MFSSGSSTSDFAHVVVGERFLLPFRSQPRQLGLHRINEFP